MDREQYLEEIRTLHHKNTDKPLFEAVVDHMKKKIATVRDFDEIIITHKLSLYALIKLLEDNHKNGLIEKLPEITMEVYALVHKLKYPYAKI